MATLAERIEILPVNAKEKVLHLVEDLERNCHEVINAIEAGRADIAAGHYQTSEQVWREIEAKHGALD